MKELRTLWGWFKRHSGHAILLNDRPIEVSCWKGKCHFGHPGETQYGHGFVAERSGKVFGMTHWRSKYLVAKGTTMIFYTHPWVFRCRACGKEFVIKPEA